MTEANGQRPPTYDHIKKAKQPTIRKVRMILDAEADLEYRTAEQELGVARLLTSEEPTVEGTKRLKEAEKREKAAKAAAEDGSVEFVFQSVGRKAFAQLLDENPPTEAQLKEAQEKDEPLPDWNIDTFPQAMVAAACLQPKLTMAEVVEMWDDPNWSGQELNDLFMAAIQCQNTRRVLEVGNV